MKKILYISLLGLLITSCGGDSKTASVDKAIESKDLATIKASRAEIQKQYDAIAAELAKLDLAIAELDTLKKSALVTTAIVNDTIFTHYIDIQGNVDTKQNLIIYPEYSGVLSQVYVKSGQKVNKGQILARIDDGGLSNQLAQMETQATLAKTTFERQKNLWDKKIGSEIQFLQAKTNYEAQMKAVAQMRAQLGKTIVKAPFSGVIDEVITEKGQVVGPGQQLMRIVNLSDMYVSANVPESFIGKIKNGAIVDVEVKSTGKIYKGKVRQIGNYINPNNRNFSIEVAVPNSDNLLRPNQVAVLKIEDYKKPNAILVPESIVTENAVGEKIIYTVDTSGKEPKAIKKTIVVGLTSGANIEVKSGLNKGEQIIIEGARSVQNGDVVEIIKK
ncbi:efflux RND transporter periplasmic adaptor subunit [Flavobacterium cheniae]|uniref:RND family efflux transporter MFP subunit n=1 Tax=Flavobacterium cheniae TaxID=295428 RepID=A0A562KM64_9FLAO|nr:efflux RND transporter periplasmic adaptor subunit [Flavobacterium cheniae]RTL10464.1 MAG: efflux RND transporter periplasmic adaptor subunit [Flavobacteriaceae bacterium]TDR24343.1 RND family efflux transporter MFP subunit [Flavobacterium cheniae]TWH96462.1 RND family efflux transporter MFP subunit [Flavobacterium cheniae]